MVYYSNISNFPFPQEYFQPDLLCNARRIFFPGNKKVEHWQITFKVLMTQLYDFRILELIRV